MARGTNPARVTDLNYQDIVQLVPSNGIFEAANDNARDMVENAGDGNIISFLPVTERDVAFHRMYMGLLSFIWGLMTPDFRENECPKPYFYVYLKRLQKHYKDVYRFRDREYRNEIREYLRSERRSKEKPKGLRLTYKQIEILAELLGKTSLSEYKSISFSRMDEVKFRMYVREQLTYIYEYVIRDAYREHPELAEMVIENVENEFERSFTKYGL
jgi:hypothetical protein